MLKPASAAALLLIAGTASAADDFDARVARASKVERSSPIGRDYLMKFMPATTEAFEKVYGDCSSEGGKPGMKDFTVVFDIDAAGNVTHIAVREQEQDDYTRCYAKGIGSIKAPPPPESFAEKGFPIVIHESHQIR